MNAAIETVADTGSVDDQYRVAFDSGSRCAMAHVARAWVDRWRALGGDFGLVWPGDGPERLTMGMIVDLDLWKPTDRQRGELEPYLCLEERSDHHGATRVLGGMLELVPGLREAVRDVVGPSVFGRA